MDSIAGNFNNCLEKIGHAAKKSGRSLQDITVVAVTKTVDPIQINQGILAGITHIGENKIQEAREKQGKVNPVQWHLVGHLQTNKVKYAVKIFDLIQSVDSLRVAKEMDKRCASLEKIMPILVEVNTSGEESKFGCHPDQAIQLVTDISRLENLQIKGLMTIGLFSEETERVRPCFRMLREIAHKMQSLQIPDVSMQILSMGMSADFEVAIEEGSTMVRIGTAIFGSREYRN